jgi:ABC-type uncharacterized transport system fused permease/ATPase subunit
MELLNTSFIHRTSTLLHCWREVLSFALLGLPAALVNSFLKYETSMLSLCFRDRLTRHLNERYVSGVNFYKAANLPQSQIENIDQRYGIVLGILFYSCFNPFRFSPC